MMGLFVILRGGVARCMIACPALRARSMGGVFSSCEMWIFNSTVRTYDPRRLSIHSCTLVRKILRRHNHAIFVSHVKCNKENSYIDKQKQWRGTPIYDIMYRVFTNSPSQLHEVSETNERGSSPYRDSVMHESVIGPNKGLDDGVVVSSTRLTVRWYCNGFEYRSVELNMREA